MMSFLEFAATPIPKTIRHSPTTQGLLRRLPDRENKMSPYAKVAVYIRYLRVAIIEPLVVPGHTVNRKVIRPLSNELFPVVSARRATSLILIFHWCQGF